MNRANSMKQTAVKKTGVKKREGKRTLVKKAIKESIHVAIDGETKHLAQEILNVVGMDMSTAIRIYLRKVIDEQGIPFEVSTDSFYSKSNLEFLDKSIKEVNEGKTHIMSLEELENMGIDDED